MRVYGMKGQCLWDERSVLYLHILTFMIKYTKGGITYVFREYQ